MEKLEEKLYDLFKVEWLTRHGIGMSDIYRAVTEWQAATSGNPAGESFEDYIEKKSGFNGYIWSSFNHWMNKRLEECCWTITAKTVEANGTLVAAPLPEGVTSTSRFTREEAWRKAMEAAEEKAYNLCTHDLLLKPNRAEGIVTILWAHNGKNIPMMVYSISRIDAEKKPKVYDSKVEVRISRQGQRMTVPFRKVKAGDIVLDRQVLCVVADDAHYSGDASYPGWMFYDRDGESWFPEDFGAVPVPAGYEDN